jgi:hypothetical protein
MGGKGRASQEADGRARHRKLIPNMPEHRLEPLMEKFTKAVSVAGVFPSAIATSE